MSQPYPIQFKQNAVALKILKIFGWTCHFDGLPSKQGVIIFYPHTSNWDFVIGILGRWAMGVQLRFLAKHTLFNIPIFGVWLKHIGGLPIVRTSPQGYVKDLVDNMKESQLQGELNWIAITPEGTRKKTPGWRSGFYRLAIEAQLPIGLAYLDFKKKEIGLTEFLTPSADEEKDLASIRTFYANKHALYPDSAAPIQFWSPRS